MFVLCIAGCWRIWTKSIFLSKSGRSWIFRMLVHVHEVNRISCGGNNYPYHLQWTKTFNSRCDSPAMWQ